MYIGYIGTENRYQRVMQLLRKHFRGDSMDPVLIIQEEDISCQQEILGAYRECIGKYDAVFLSGTVSYQYILQNQGTPSFPTEYIHKEMSTLLTALLKARLGGFDLLNISIDTFDRYIIEEAFKMVGLPTAINVRIVDTDYLCSNIFRDIVQKHVTNYRKNNVSCCITFLSVVYKQLSERNIPCLLAEPSDEAILDAVQRLHAQYGLHKQNHLRFASVVLEITNYTEDFSSENNSYDTQIDYLKATEQILRFAQMIKAAVMQKDQRHFMLITQKDDLDRETDALSKIPIFKMVRIASACDIYMGIGYGSTLMLSQSRAEYGFRRSRKFAPNSVFICYEEDKTIGPVEYLPRNVNEEESEIDNCAFVIASECSLHQHTINKLYSIISGKGKEYFTAQELAKCYGVSIRTMYRILNKLVDNGYARFEGRDAKQTSGRPRMVYKILL